MANLLGEMDSNVPTRRPKLSDKTSKSDDRRKIRVLSPPIKAISKSRSDKVDKSSLPDTPPAEGSSDAEDGFLPPLDDGDALMSDPVPSSPIAKAVERKILAAVKTEEEEDEDMEISQVVMTHNVKATSVNLSGSRPVPKIIKQPSYPTPENSSPTHPPVDAVDAASWNSVTSKLNVLSSSPQTTSYGRIGLEHATEEDGSMRMFWTDYTEVNGSLCLFGKVKDKKSGAYVSALVKIDNILRKLYFLPREYRKSKCSKDMSRFRALIPLVNGRDATDEVTMEDVYQEIDGLMTKLRVDMHKIKPCSRKYAFELPDIPKEADYLKLMYPYASKSPCYLMGPILTQIQSRHYRSI